MAEKQETPTVIVENTTEAGSKKFQIPSIDQVVKSIKELDEEIEHVSLNLIKCNFQATQNDVKKAFPEYKDKFIKVKQYKPGSFQVVFQARMDAIEFTRNAPGKRILGRIFLVKIGRNYKNDKQDWVYVEAAGNDKRKHHHKNNKPYQHRNVKQQGEETKTHEKKEEHHQEKEVQKEKEAPQFKQQTVEEKKLEKKTIDSKYIKTDKPKDYKKDTKETKEFHHPQVKREPVPVKVEEPVKQQQPKPVQTKPEPKQTKQTKPKAAQKQAPKKQQPKKQQDDGWVTVGKKGRR